MVGADRDKDGRFIMLTAVLTPLRLVGDREDIVIDGDACFWIGANQLSRRSAYNVLWHESAVIYENTQSNKRSSHSPSQVMRTKELHAGKIQDSVEPDAEKYKCDDCGARAVYGAEQLLLIL